MGTARQVSTSVVEWVTVDRAAERVGITRQSIYAMVKRHTWVLGRQYVKRGRRLFVNMPEVYAWIAQG